MNASEKMFDELASMCFFAIEREDIELLEHLLEDREEAVREWLEWKQKEEDSCVN